MLHVLQSKVMIAKNSSNRPDCLLCLRIHQILQTSLLYKHRIAIMKPNRTSSPFLVDALGLNLETMICSLGDLPKGPIRYLPCPNLATN